MRPTSGELSPVGRERVSANTAPGHLRLDEFPPTHRDGSLPDVVGEVARRLPLGVGGSVLGGLSFVALTREHDWSLVGDGLRLMSEIVGKVLARKLVHLQLQEALAFQRLIAEVSAALIDRPPRGVRRECAAPAHQVGEVLDLDRCTVTRWDSTRRSIPGDHQWVREGAADSRSCRAGHPVGRERVRSARAIIYSSVDELPARGLSRAKAGRALRCEVDGALP